MTSLILCNVIVIILWTELFWKKFTILKVLIWRKIISSRRVSDRWAFDKSRFRHLVTFKNFFLHFFLQTSSRKLTRLMDFSWDLNTLFWTWIDTFLYPGYRGGPHVPSRSHFRPLAWTIIKISKKIKKFFLFKIAELLFTRLPWFSIPRSFLATNYFAKLTFSSKIFSKTTNFNVEFRREEGLLAIKRIFEKRTFLFEKCSLVKNIIKQDQRQFKPW